MKRHSKIHSSFYKRLIQTFLVIIATSSFILGLLWIGLNYYESTTPNGALINYTDSLKAKKYKQIYEESKKVFDQYNEEDIYVNYLSEFYKDMDLNNLDFIKKDYGSSDFQYYDMVINEEVIASLEIKKDSSKNKWNARTLTDVHSYRVDTQYTDMQMFINEYLVGADRVVSKDIPSSAFKNLKNQDEAPLINQYFIDNMITEPTFILKNADYAIINDALLDQYYIGKIVTGDTLTEFEELIKKVATTYCMYITEDETFNNLRKLLYTKTEFYDAIRSFNNGFFSAHDSIEFENMDVFDIIQLSDNSFIGSVSFDYIVNVDERSQTYSSTYQLTFLDVKGKWLVTNLTIANE